MRSCKIGVVMRGITILDKSPDGKVLSFDLKDILGVIEPRVRSLRWRLEGIECLGEGADKLHKFSDSDEPLSGGELIELSRQVYQVIDGDFHGYRGEAPGPDNPWLIIRAVDSSAFDVECNDLSVLESVKSRFSKVIDIPA